MRWICDQTIKEFIGRLTWLEPRLVPPLPPPAEELVDELEQEDAMDEELLAVDLDEMLEPIDEVDDIILEAEEHSLNVSRVGEDEFELLHVRKAGCAIVADDEPTTEDEDRCCCCGCCWPGSKRCEPIVLPRRTANILPMDLFSWCSI